MLTIAGHHHVSMITKDAQQNIDFYRDKLGLRLVKKTVNQDTPFMYHLFYGDLTGSPGTELTFFEMPNVGSTHRGTNAITKIGLLVQNKDVLTYWKKRFEHFGIVHGDIFTYEGRLALPFKDPDGLPLLLIDHEEMETPSFWKKWEESSVPSEFQILGLGPIEMTVRRPKKLGDMLTNVFHYEEISSSENGGIYQSVKGKAYSEIVVKKRLDKAEKPGRGSVHHLAIRVKNEQEMYEWKKVIEDYGYDATDVIDRHYFHSLYVKDANEIVFELATDGPGLDVDETVEALGESLALPPFLEEKRAEIEAQLIPIA